VGLLRNRAAVPSNPVADRRGIGSGDTAYRFMSPRHSASISGNVPLVTSARIRRRFKRRALRPDEIHFPANNVAYHSGTVIGSIFSPRAGRPSIVPQIFELACRQLNVAYGVLNVAVPEVCLNGVRGNAIVGKLKPGGVT
jgi:hypothetical protein